MRSTGLARSMAGKFNRHGHSKNRFPLGIELASVTSRMRGPEGVITARSASSFSTLSHVARETPFAARRPVSSIRRQRNLIVDQRIERGLDVDLGVDHAGLLQGQPAARMESRCGAPIRL